MANAQPNNQDQETEKVKAESWNDIVSRAKEIPDILPTLKMTQDKEIIRKEAKIEFLEDMPRRINFMNKRTKKDDHFFGITVKDIDTGEQLTLPVSAVSLQNALGKLYEEKGSLSNVRARVWVDHYQHKQYGKTLRYNVAELTTT